MIITILAAFGTMFLWWWCGKIAYILHSKVDSPGAALRDYPAHYILGPFAFLFWAIFAIFTRVD